MKKRRYVIMANGSGTRWGGHQGIPKQLIRVCGETLLARLTRQIHVHDPNAAVIISSANPLLVAEGAQRHTPARNSIELDRFVPELIEDGVTFLYGDTYYEDEALARIVVPAPSALAFYGDLRGIVALLCTDARTLLEHIERVRELYLARVIEKCIGWQLYQSYAGLPFGEPAIGRDFIELEGLATGFNSPSDLAQFIARQESRTPHDLHL